MWIARIASVKSMKTIINLSWGIPPPPDFICIYNLGELGLYLSCCHVITPSFPPSPPPHQETYMYIIAEAEFMNLQYRWGF